MPYDPRPVSEGGNRGIDFLFSRNAPLGMYRVVSVDTFDGTDSLERDYKRCGWAKRFCKKRAQGKQMFKIYVFDDQGECVHEEGVF